MQVEVKLFFHLRRHAPAGAGQFSLELADGASIGQALAVMGIPESPPKVLLVNGLQAGLDAVLREGDALVIFPPVEGG